MTFHFAPVVVDDATDVTTLPAVRAAVDLAVRRVGWQLESEDAMQEALFWLSKPSGKRRVLHAQLPDGTVHVAQLAADIWQRRLRTLVQREHLWRDHHLLTDWTVEPVST